MTQAILFSRKTTPKRPPSRQLKVPSRNSPKGALLSCWVARYHLNIRQKQPFEEASVCTGCPGSISRPLVPVLLHPDILKRIREYDKPSGRIAAKTNFYSRFNIRTVRARISWPSFPQHSSQRQRRTQLAYLRRLRNNSHRPSSSILSPGKFWCRSGIHCVCIRFHNDRMDRGGIAFGRLHKFSQVAALFILGAQTRAGCRLLVIALCNGQASAVLHIAIRCRLFSRLFPAEALRNQAGPTRIRWSADHARHPGLSASM
jgi:hypothetical protein